MRFLPGAVVLILIATAGPSLAKPEAVDQPQPVHAGDLFTDQVLCEFAIYLLPGNKTNPDDELAQLLAKDPFWTRLAKVPDRAEKPILVTKVINDVAKSYIAPTEKDLHYFGREITAEQAAAVQKSLQVYLLDFAYPEKDIWAGLRNANQLAGKLGEATGGLVWDEETRELFSPESWKKLRLDSWPVEGVPDTTTQYTIHAYKDGDYIRAITLGMSKFGLPDIAVNDLVWSDQSQAGHLINALGQELAEGRQVQKEGFFDLDLRDIKQNEMRVRFMDKVYSGGKYTAKLRLLVSTREQGDAHNRQMQIAFDRYDGPDNHARQSALFDSVFGAKDDIKTIRHNDEVREASAHARTKLPDLRAAFQKGLAPGEYIQLKAPFKGTDEKTEWMWVEIVTWKGDAITGLLKNEPYWVPSLHAGQTVTISEKEVFDYLHIFPDGHDEGNETGKVIEKMPNEK